MDFMLMRDLVAQKVERASPLSSPTTRDFQVLQGSLWWCDPTRDRTPSLQLRLMSKEFDDVHLECAESDVKSLTEQQFSLLFALNTCKDRFRLVKNYHLMNELVQVKPSSSVTLVNVTGLPEKVKAVVRYVGPITGLSGRWFGVELLPPNHKIGSCDGEFKGVRYFECHSNAGMFVPANKIIPVETHASHLEPLAYPQHDEASLSSSSGSSYIDVRTSTNEAISHPQATYANVSSVATGFSTRTESPILENPPEIEIGERIVYISDAGPELGVVKWIGILPDSKHREYTIGVEFDNPIGTGTGKYNNEQLFRAKQNHASLVPALGLMTAKMFYGENVPPPPPPVLTEPVQHSDHAHVDILRSPHPDTRTTGYRNKPATVLPAANSPVDSYLHRFQTSAQIKQIPTTQTQVPFIPAKQGPEERSIYDQEPTHLYENMKKEESGRMSQAKPHASSYPQQRTRNKDFAHDDHGSVYRLSDNSQVAQKSKDDKKFTNAPYMTGNSTFYGRHRTNGILAGPVIQDESNGFLASGFTLPSNKVRIPESSDGGEIHLPPGCERPGLSPNMITKTAANYSTVLPNKNTDLCANTGLPARNPSPSFRDFKVDSDQDRNLFQYPVQASNHKGSEVTGPDHKELENSATTHRCSEIRGSDESRFVAVDPRDIQTDLDIGSMVEVINGPPECRYGVVRWMGREVCKKDPQKIIAGLEMEEEGSAFTDGNFGSTRCFTCAPNKAFFVYLHKLKPDSRFDESVSFIERHDSQVFGVQPCPDIEGVRAPPCVQDIAELHRLVGKERGIQGHHNSCYLDASLFAMFAFTSAFDSILFRPRQPDDIEQYDTVQKALREGIVNPLRTNFFVRADKVLRLRKLLDKLSSIEGLMNEEKDPEEFLTGLLQQTLKMEPFIKLSSGQECYHYTLFMEKEDRIMLPSTQDLLTLSFLQANLKFDKVPSVLMLQMPRFGKDYKMYSTIIPSLQIDITDMLNDSPRECTICGALASHECKDCFRHFGESLDKIAFCENCLKKSHVHAKRAKHRPQPISVSPDYFRFLEERRAEGLPDPPIHRETLELFAVVCIQTSHYVTFVKCGSGLEAPWVFFDSMADRMGTQHGYNVPEVQICNFLPSWLSDPDYTEIKTHSHSKQLPEQMRRLLCDGYIAMYQSPSLLLH